MSDWLKGYIVGIIPGAGGDVATFVAYGQAKQTSKHPERFGTGIVEGVIAPESANNAKEGGALLTTLALGIPGSAIMALILGAFLILGLIPGPDMMTKHLDLSLSLLLATAVANVIGVVICLLVAPSLGKVATIPSRILVPLIMVIALAGSFAYRERFDDVIVAIIFGVMGLAMVRFGFNRPALLLGYILGGLFERYLLIANRAEGHLFFMRPISLALIFIIIALYASGPIKKLVQHWRGARKSKDNATE